MNKFKKPLFAIIVLGVALIFTACSNNDNKINNNSGTIDDENVIGTVNGKAISKEEYDQAVAYYKDYVEYQYGEGSWERDAGIGMTNREYYENYVMDSLTYRLLLLDAAEKEKIVPGEEEIQEEFNSFKTYFENDEAYDEYLAQGNITEEYILQELKTDLMVNKYLLDKIQNMIPTDDELKTIFDDLKMDTKVKASHILVDTEEEALKVIERINNGEDFAELAKEVSVDTASGTNGGDLDYFTYEQMVQPFSEAAFAMEIGEVSQPVKSDYGYHIIKLTDKIVDESITVESEKDKLTEDYKTNKYQELLKKLKSEAEIVIK